MPAHETGLSIIGDRETGRDVRGANVAAVITLANILKTSLGPHGEGLWKFINYWGEYFGDQFGAAR